MATYYVKGHKKPYTEKDLVTIREALIHLSMMESKATLSHEDFEEMERELIENFTTHYYEMSHVELINEYIEELGEYHEEE